MANYLTQEHDTRVSDLSTDSHNASEENKIQGELLTENKLILLSQPTEMIYLQFQGNDNFLLAVVYRISKNISNMPNFK